MSTRACAPTLLAIGAPATLSRRARSCSTSGPRCCAAEGTSCRHHLRARQGLNDAASISPRLERRRVRLRIPRKRGNPRVRLDADRSTSIRQPLACGIDHAISTSPPWSAVVHSHGSPAVTPSYSSRARRPVASCSSPMLGRADSRRRVQRGPRDKVAVDASCQHPDTKAVASSAPRPSPGTYYENGTSSGSACRSGGARTHGGAPGRGAFDLALDARVRPGSARGERWHWRSHTGHGSTRSADELVARIKTGWPPRVALAPTNGPEMGRWSPAAPDKSRPTGLWVREAPRSRGRRVHQ